MNNENKSAIKIQLQKVIEAISIEFLIESIKALQINMMFVLIMGSIWDPQGWACERGKRYARGGVRALLLSWQFHYTL